MNLYKTPGEARAVAKSFYTSINGRKMGGGKEDWRQNYETQHRENPDHAHRELASTRQPDANDDCQRARETCWG
jgi:hypothetical protein